MCRKTIHESNIKKQHSVSRKIKIKINSSSIKRVSLYLWQQQHTALSSWLFQSKKRFAPWYFHPILKKWRTDNNKKKDMHWTTSCQIFVWSDWFQVCTLHVISSNTMHWLLIVCLGIIYKIYYGCYILSIIGNLTKMLLIGTRYLI